MKRCTQENESGQPCGRPLSGPWLACREHETETLLDEETERAVDFSSLSSIRTTMAYVTKAVLTGRLDAKVANAAVSSSKLGAQTYVMESEIENHWDKRLAQMPEDEFRKQVDAWREAMRKEALDS